MPKFMMPKYEVKLPVSGFIVKHVEAVDEASAIAEALKENWPEGPGDLESIEGLRAHNKLVEGNVCYAEIPEAEAINISTDDPSA